MNQQKIGIFIAGCRKEKGLIQVQLAEIVGVSDKSISRWHYISELLYAKRMTDNEKTEQGEL